MVSNPLDAAIRPISIADTLSLRLEIMLSLCEL
jgi:hypothetical protein